MLTMEELKKNILNHKYFDGLLANGFNPFSKIQEVETHRREYLYHNLALLNQESYDYFINKWKNDYNYKMNKYEFRINAKEIINLTLKGTPLWFIKKHKEFIWDILCHVDGKNIEMVKGFIDQDFEKVFSINNILHKIAWYYNEKPLDQVEIRNYLFKNINKEGEILNIYNIKNINTVISETDFIKYFIKNEYDLKKYLDLTLWESELNYNRDLDKEYQVHVYEKIIPLINNFDYVLDEKYDMLKKMKQTVTWISEDSYHQPSMKKDCEKLELSLDENINFYKAQKEKESIQTKLTHDNENRIIQIKKRI